MKRSQIILAAGAFVLAIGSAFTTKSNANKATDVTGYYSVPGGAQCVNSSVSCTTTVDGTNYCTIVVGDVNYRLYTNNAIACDQTPLYKDPI